MAIQNLITNKITDGVEKLFSAISTKTLGKFKAQDENMYNAISKTLEVTITISIAFKDFNFVVTAFGKTISKFGCKRIKDTSNPSKHSFSTLLERLYTTAGCAISQLD